MKLTLRVGAAMAIIALAGCSQGGQDNQAENADMNAGYANETTLPSDENTAGTDTLGNQLSQLNESDMNISNSDMDNSSRNMTNET